MSKLDLVIQYLSDNVILPPEYKNHYLLGNYKGYSECHLEFDWVLIYSIDIENNILYLVRTGTHHDLFS